MTATKTMTYATVSSIFEAQYERLRELMGENAPNSWTWCAPTLAELQEECDWAHCEEVNGAVAYITECNGNDTRAITPGMTEAQVADLIWEFFGVSEEEECE